MKAKKCRNSSNNQFRYLVSNGLYLNQLSRTSFLLSGCFFFLVPGDRFYKFVIRPVHF